MKCLIEDLSVLALTIVINCAFPAKPAQAQEICQVTSTRPCIVNLNDTGYHNVHIMTGQVVLAVYTNNSFKNPASVTLTVAGQSQTPVVLQSNESRWKDYSFQNVNGIRLQASSSVDKPDVIVVLVQSSGASKFCKEGE
ncbi:MAG: hypothetical protein F6K21_20595 [Symploca sp. SIO2D2]|nr:hypothetical protein [Symploca sp. SIO2D2]